ncbi:Stromal membrane-associated protein 2 [Seminavis robusta]|uniref:Stromal membrane-associated protein 2 n=1 Tax=Seminavis robusta TaxID=568900 RepID=A0A9N8H686_9STRA|nr:Stromal membrane-associated protein 2 [Seminavis robusta]|eukprot:Sro164_g073570.1 Stromal membrane-associated protein 2 (243) ;mRNA; f:36149-37000
MSQPVSTTSTPASKKMLRASSNRKFSPSSTASPTAVSPPTASSSNDGSLTEMAPEDWKVVAKLPGNKNCIDCNAKYPQWGSVNFGILFCTRCCSGHRSLGTHISRVRSIHMDSWTESQVKLMKVGGNQQCEDWFAKHGMRKKVGHKSKYDNETAKLYSEILLARAEGRREPTSLKDAERLNKWNKPIELWNRFMKEVEGRRHKSLMQQFQAISSSSDFWLVLYICALVGWSFLVFIAWQYHP